MTRARRTALLVAVTGAGQGSSGAVALEVRHRVDVGTPRDSRANELLSNAEQHRATTFPQHYATI